MVMLASSFNQYSYEARPYAFVSAFLGILALGWQRAIQQEKPRSWISYLLILVGGFGMLLSHVLASVAYAALLLQRPFASSCAASPIGFSGYVLYSRSRHASPICNPSRRILQGPSQNNSRLRSLIYSQPIPISGSDSYRCSAWPSSPSFYWHDKTDPASSDKSPRRFHLAGEILALGLCCVPLVVNFVFMHSHSAYFLRYGIPAIFGVAILTPWFISRWTCNSSLAALICSIFFIFGVVTPSSIARHLQHVVQPIKPQGSDLTGKFKIPLSQVQPDLPLVDNSGLTFLEMNHRENSTFLSARLLPQRCAGCRQVCQCDHLRRLSYVERKIPDPRQHHAVSGFHPAASEVSCSGNLRLSRRLAPAKIVGRSRRPSLSGRLRYRLHG